MAEDLEKVCDGDKSHVWWQMFNQHQEDSRKRADFLAKSIFLLSGGTLTLSIEHYTDKNELTPCLIHALQFSWVLLVLSIILALIDLVLILRRDYNLGERWRRQLCGEVVDVAGVPTILDSLIWVVGVSSIMAFIFGLLLQTYLACVQVSL